MGNRNVDEVLIDCTCSRSSAHLTLFIGELISVTLPLLHVAKQGRSLNQLPTAQSWFHPRQARVLATGRQS